MIVTHSEYEKIVDLLGREPSPTELGVFEVMWSEHCSTDSAVDGATVVEPAPTETGYGV